MTVNLLLPEFLIDKTPVTNAEFARFVKETSYQTEAEKVGSSFGMWKPANLLEHFMVTAVALMQ